MGIKENGICDGDTITWSIQQTHEQSTHQNGNGRPVKQKQSSLQNNKMKSDLIKATSLMAKLEQQLETMSCSNLEKTNECHKKEQIIIDLQMKVDETKSHCDNLENELQTMRIDNLKITHDCHQKDQTIADLQVQIEELKVNL